MPTVTWKSSVLRTFSENKTPYVQDYTLSFFPFSAETFWQPTWSLPSDILLHLII